MLTREAILNVVPVLDREEVKVPEWGGSIYVRTLTGSERDRIELEWSKTERKNFRARLVVATACDESGKPLFVAQDLPAIGNQAAPVLERICEVALRLNKFTNEDVKELEKNSESGPSGG